MVFRIEVYSNINVEELKVDVDVNVNWQHYMCSRITEVGVTKPLILPRAHEL